jgi:hypothetical protein
MDDFWSIISVFLGAIAAIAAAFAVYQTAKSYKDQLEANRPYFMITDQGFKQLPNGSPPYRLIISLKNIGNRPARGFHERIMYITSELKGAANLLYDSSVSNELAPGETTHWFSDTVQFTKDDILPHYFIVAIKYGDPLTHKDYKQTFVYKWHGSKEHKTYPILMYISKEEAEKVLKYLEKDLEEFKIV